MSELQFENGTKTRDLSAIADALAPLGVKLERVAPPASGEAAALLGKAALDDAEKARLALLLDPVIAGALAAHAVAFATRDVIVLHGGIPKIDEVLAPFAPCHRHDDHETRWIVDGGGVFGFVKDGGAQVALTVEAGDFIQVPAGVEHWFVLTADKRIKAVRHFVDKAGWVPRYTGDAGAGLNAEDLKRASRRLAARGLCDATSGNFSARLPGGGALMSRSGVDKSALETADFLMVDAAGKVSTGKASAETPLHLAIYAGRPAAHVVLHTHGVHASVISRRRAGDGVVVLRGWEMLKALEGVTTHDHEERVPVFANTQDMAALARDVTARLEAEPRIHAFLVAGHGLTTWGRTTADAVRQTEALEHLFACELA